MPLYEYRCGKCSQEFELLVLKSARGECPHCRSQELEQLISGFAVSSDGIRRSNIQTARRQNAASGSYRDEKQAEKESTIASIKEHG